MLSEQVKAEMAKMPNGVPVVVNMGRNEMCNGSPVQKIELVEAQIHSETVFGIEYETWCDSGAEKHLIINITG